MEKHRRLFIAFFTLQTILLFFFAGGAQAERLPVKTYTSADGLGSSFINHIVRDSRGFMWFCTRDGLSRFDGSRFVTYKIGAENSPPGIETIFESRNGDYWITTTGGLFRFKPDALSNSDQPDSSTPTLNAEFLGSWRGNFLEDRNGNLWFANGRSLNLIKEKDGKIVLEPINLNLPPHPNRSFGIADIAEAADGSLWINTSWGAVRRLPDGRLIFYDGETQNTVGNMSMRIDASGRIWLLRALELFIIKPEPSETLTDPSPVVIQPLRKNHSLIAKKEQEIKLPDETGDILYLSGGDILTEHYAKRLFETSDRHIWLTTERDLYEFDGRVFRSYGAAQGFPAGLTVINEDTAGNLWIGGRNGLVRLDRKGFVSYGTADGFTSDSVQSINESTDGTLYFADSDLHLNKFDGKKFNSMRPAIAPKLLYLWTSRYAFLDSRGEWWILTNEKLYRFAASDLNKPSAIYTSADGLKSDAAFQIFEDSRGEIWVSTKPTYDEGFGLSRFIRDENRFQTFTEADGFPPNKSVSSFAEDAQGNLWLGFYESGIARYSGGRFTVFTEGLPGGLVSDLHIDGRGRLWLSSSEGGLLRLDDTTAENPQFVSFTTANGLSSNNIRTITEDKFGRIYLGTVRGVDRLSPDTNFVKHYSILDGLAADFVNDSYCDKNGVLWFATTGGLSRLVPLPDEKTSPPTVFLGSLRIAGVEQAVSQLGEVNIEKGELAHTDNNFQIEFFGLDFRAGENLRYQYRLEGADDDWSVSTELRTVNYANLQPGTYRFLVRAVNTDDASSENPAVVSFKILPPIWARWWFMLLSALFVLLIIFMLYYYRTANLREINLALSEAKNAEEKLSRSRAERIVELEKVRSRIATDLHDDIGSSLTQIAILSEVAQAQSKNGISEPLKVISNVSNELVGTMSDIVWSINPAKDHLADLTQRMRRFASDVLSAKQIGVHFDAPDSNKEIIVGTNLRREVFLIFKESVNNIVKHSGAKQVKMTLKISDGELNLKITDDGKGFDLSALAAETNALFADQTGGNGILSMKKRAAEMNGEFFINAEIGSGASVYLSLPLENKSDSPTRTGGVTDNLKL